MSKNCISCVVRPRTGIDLLCDECRHENGSKTDRRGECRRPDLEFYINKQGVIAMQLGRECFRFRDPREARLVAAALIHQADLAEARKS